ITLTHRVTRTSGSSGSIFTSQNCAPKLWNPSLLLSLKSNFPSASIEFIPLLFSVSVNDSGLSRFAPRSVSFFFKLAAASAMAEPTATFSGRPHKRGLRTIHRMDDVIELDHGRIVENVRRSNPARLHPVSDRRCHDFTVITNRL